MTVDCFMFCHELEILKIRLNELDSVVDRFVIVESPLTFSGNPKPLYYDDNYHLFEKWWPKIRYTRCYPLVTDDPWKRQDHQRDQLMIGIKDLHDNDVVIVSDVDEIPNHESVAYYSRKEADTMSLKQRGFSFYLNLETDSWNLGKITRYRELKSTSPNQLRGLGSRSLNAGWHFSRMGGPAMHKIKVESCSHTEFIIPDFPDDRPGKLVEEGILKVAEIDISFPKYVVENKQRLKLEGYIYG